MYGIEEISFPENDQKSLKNLLNKYAKKNQCVYN